jgi:hypothetical protein
MIFVFVDDKELPDLNGFTFDRPFDFTQCHAVVAERETSFIFPSLPIATFRQLAATRPPSIRLS